MSTTTYTFTGNETQAISFSPTLDSTVYSASVKWLLAAQRWYITVTASDGTRMLTRPMIESPDDTDINLAFGVFTTTIVWRASSGLIEVTS